MNRNKEEPLNINEIKPENPNDAANKAYQDLLYLNSIGPDLISLGKDSDCPLSFPMVQQSLDEYKYKIQNQQNQILFIQDNISQIQSLIANLTGENDILQSIVNDFDENYKIKNKVQTNLKSQEVINYVQKSNSVAFELLQYETKLTEDVSNVSQISGRIKTLQIMSDILQDQLNSSPALGADQIIDLLENDIENLEEKNQKMNDKYISLLRKSQDEIDQLKFQLESKSESYFNEETNVPPPSLKKTKRKRVRRNHK